MMAISASLSTVLKYMLKANDTLSNKQKQNPTNLVQTMTSIECDVELIFFHLPLMVTVSYI